MRELKTLEVDKWVPGDKPGLVKHSGMISPQEAFDLLEAHLEKEGLLPDEYFLAGLWRYDNKPQLPDYRQANCCVNWGGSEGIYLNISLVYREGNEIKYFDFATGKTLGQSGDDFLRMSRIAAECSMMLNGRGDVVRFYEEEKKNTGLGRDGEAKSLDLVIQEVQNKQKSALSDVARFLGDIQGEKANEFVKKYGLEAKEILSDSSLLSRIVSEKQNLQAAYPKAFVNNDFKAIETAIYNVCLAHREELQKTRLEELRGKRTTQEER